VITGYVFTAGVHPLISAAVVFGTDKTFAGDLSLIPSLLSTQSSFAFFFFFFKCSFLRS